jgi:hypothetical protein
MRHRKYMAVCFNVQTTEIVQSYFHDDAKILQQWVRREGFADSPDFDFFVADNPLLTLQQQ